MAETPAIPVEVVAVAPTVLDEAISSSKKSVVQNQVLDPSAPAKTTFQEDLTTAGQRRVNLVWEYTQAFIAIIVVLTTMGVGGFLAIVQSNAQVPSIISVAFGMITGFYFSRTNHAAIGGVGRKPADSEYRGR